MTWRSPYPVRLRPVTRFRPWESIRRAVIRRGSRDRQYALYEVPLVWREIPEDYEPVK